jgi:probable rRNA maturation factor
MILNQQKAYALPRLVLQDYVRSLKRNLPLGKCDFNVCFVDDRTMRRMNGAFRGQDRSTDVLSFPWNDHAGPRRTVRPSPRRGARPTGGAEFQGFLGDIVISVETARRNARQEGHSTRNEIRWLILHGVLHLLGYDHTCDNGEMIALELALRDRLGVAGGRPVRRGR